MSNNDRRAFNSQGQVICGSGQNVGRAINECEPGMKKHRRGIHFSPTASALASFSTATGRPDARPTS
jgi:hypothetical protein